MAMDKNSIGKTTNSSALRPKAPVPAPQNPPTIKAAPATPQPPAAATAKAIPSAPAKAVTPAPAPTKPPAPATAPVTAKASDKREVKFELYQRNARSVFVAGTFNAWNPQATPLQSTVTGKWETSLKLAPGKYEYRFIVDGKWLEDPLAKESVPNPFGGTNSVLSVK